MSEMEERLVDADIRARVRRSQKQHGKKQCPDCGSGSVRQEDYICECYDCGFVWDDEDYTIREG